MAGGGGQVISHAPPTPSNTGYSFVLTSSSSAASTPLVTQLLPLPDFDENGYDFLAIDLPHHL